MHTLADPGSLQWNIMFEATASQLHCLLLHCNVNVCVFFKWMTDNCCIKWRANNILTGWHAVRLEIKSLEMNMLKHWLVTSYCGNSSGISGNFGRTYTVFANWKKCYKAINKAYLIRVFPNFFMKYLILEVTASDLKIPFSCLEHTAKLPKNENLFNTLVLFTGGFHFFFFFFYF